MKETIKDVALLVLSLAAIVGGWMLLGYAMEVARLPTVGAMLLVLGWLTLPQIYQILKEWK